MSNENFDIEDKIILIQVSNDFNKVKKSWLPPCHKKDYYFASYAHKDYKLVFESLHRLQSGENSINVWYDEGLTPGKDWEDNAYKYIYNPDCKGVIFYLSENSILSQSIHREIEFVKNSGVPYLSINLPCEMVEGYEGKCLSAETMLTLLKRQGKCSIDETTYEEKLKVLSETFHDKIIFISFNENIERQKDKIRRLSSEETTDKNEEKIKELEKVANQGNANAQFVLGSFYLLGTGVSKDYEKAVFWLEKAANQGHAEAQFSLGNCYESGIGVPKDIKKAMSWMEKAAMQGYANAQCALGLYYAFNVDGKENYDKAVSWFEKAASQGHAFAQFSLGNCYDEGLGVTQDDKEALSWYQKAADQGLMDAQFALGDCYETGTGVSKDEKEAVFWYQKAAEQGDDDAKEALGRIMSDKS